MSTPNASVAVVARRELGHRDVWRASLSRRIGQGLDHLPVPQDEVLKSA
jgi:hypothetical protein